MWNPARAQAGGVFIQRPQGRGTSRRNPIKASRGPEGCARSSNQRCPGSGSWIQASRRGRPECTDVVWVPTSRAKPVPRWSNAAPALLLSQRSPHCPLRAWLVPLILASAASCGSTSNVRSARPHGTSSARVNAERSDGNCRIVTDVETRVPPNRRSGWLTAAAGWPPPPSCRFRRAWRRAWARMMWYVCRYRACWQVLLSTCAVRQATAAPNGRSVHWKQARRPHPAGC